MKIVKDILDVSVVGALNSGQLTVFKSDTIYGIFASALSLDAFSALSLVRPKSEGKYYIVLAANTDQLESFNLNADSLKMASKLWPGPITAVIKTENINFKHLANKDGEIGFRIPADRKLRELLNLSGPLLSPSCNPEGQLPAANITEAINYFGEKVAVYADSGQVPPSQPPSTVIKISSSEPELLREGKFKFNVIKNKLEIDTDKKEPYKKRKLYKFGLFASHDNCFEEDQFKFSNYKSEYAEVNLEVGAGTADLSLGLAQKFKNQLFIATDVKADRLVQGAIKAKSLGLGNILFVRANTRSLLSLIEPRSISNLWITFPDPMPKDRQEKHRLVNGQFLAIYKNLLGEYGQILFKTDDRNLFNYGLEQIVNILGQIDVLSFDLHASRLKDEYKITTVYERKFIKVGKPINFVKFRL